MNRNQIDIHGQKSISIPENSEISHQFDDSNIDEEEKVENLKPPFKKSQHEFKFDISNGLVIPVFTPDQKFRKTQNQCFTKSIRAKKY